MKRTSVSAFWNMRCPQCGGDEQIDIAATVWIRLCPDGTDVTAAENGDHEWDDDNAAICHACGHCGTVRDFRIREAIAERVVWEPGINALPLPLHQQSAILKQIEHFADFNPGNDPHGKRDFGAFAHNGQRIFWKIDHCAPDKERGGENPSGAAQTVRVLTIMLASEYRLQRDRHGGGPALQPDKEILE